MRKKGLFSALLTALAAVFMLCGCDTPQSGKPGSTNSSAEPGDISYIPSVENNAQDKEAVSFEKNAVIYDHCGVKLTLTSTENYGSLLHFKAENTTDEKFRLRSAYVMTGDLLDKNSQNVFSVLSPGGTDEFDLSLPKSSGSLRMKLYLSDNNYSYVEGSLSDVITLISDSNKTLQTAQPGKPVYEDERIKLTFTGVQYNRSTNAVRFYFCAVNKTDTDYELTTLETSCDHADYRFSMSSYIPARSRTDITAAALTSNKTITSAELNSVNFDLALYEADESITKAYNAKYITRTDQLCITLNETGRPETTVPDTVTPARSLEEFKEEMIEDFDLTELPAPDSSSVLKYSSDDVKIEYAGTFKGIEDDSDIVYLCYKVTNGLDKPIVLDSVGTVNGATADFDGRCEIPLMTEEYIKLTYRLPSTKLFGDLTDAEIMFTVSYNDGHYDGSSRIFTTDRMTVKLGERKDLSKVIPERLRIYSDDICDVYLLGRYTEETSAYFGFYCVNKTDRSLEISVYPSDSELYFLNDIELLPHTWRLKTLRLRLPEGMTEEAVKALGFEIVTEYINDN